MSRQSRADLIIVFGVCIIALAASWSIPFKSAFLTNLTNVSLLPIWLTLESSIDMPACKEIALGMTLGEIKPVSQRSLMAMGRAAWLSGRCGQAKVLWSQATEMIPTDLTAWYLLGHAYYAEGDVIKAIEAYTKAGAGAYLFQKGVLADKHDSVDVSTQWYELSLAVAPSLPVVETLHYRYMVSGQADRAIAAWRQLAQATGIDDPIHWRAIAQAARLNEDWEGVLEAYEHEVALIGDRFNFYLQAGYLFQQQQDYERAKNYFLQAVEAYPGGIEAYLAIGDLERRMGNYDAAKNWFKQAGQLDSTSELPDYYLGRVLRDEMKIAEAQQHFQAAFVKNPKNVSVLYYLALGEADMSDLQAAIRYMEQAMILVRGLAPWNWHLLLGRWYLAVGDCASANRVFMNLSQQNHEVMQAREEFRASCTTQP